MTTIDRLRTLLKNDFDAVNNLISGVIQSHAGLANEMPKHIVQSGGKRLRPLLVLLAANACGYQGEHHITHAAVIEFFHTATLLHDDVVDESTLRRGQETANSIWGSKASILVGDFLLTKSMQLLAQAGILETITLIANTSYAISCGELQQLANKHNTSLSVESYYDVIRSKTALLFAASARIGAIISNQSEEVKNALYAYGLHLGNAFQLIDDALDYCSDSQTLGKNIGDDLADGKATLPLIHALNHASPRQKDYITESLKTGSLEFLPEIQKALDDTKAIEYTKQIAATEIDHALSALDILPPSDYKVALNDLAVFALERSY